MTTAGAAQVYRVVIRATPEAIWEAITTPEFTRRDFHGARITNTPERHLALAPDGRTWGDEATLEWDPPRRLVVRGPYAYVRNPMISGVLFVLLGEALLLLSRPHLEWALICLLINAVYIPLLEEPMLLERFGDAYREYCRHVPRLLPRLRPWRRSA